MKRQSLTRFVRSFTSKPLSKPNQSVNGRRILLERLEDRLAPATYIWSGSGADNKWSTAANWVGNVAPTGSAASLDSLVFPSGAARLTNTNDLAGTPTFGSITISGSNYSLGGNKVVLGNPAVSGSGSLIANSGVAGAAIDLDVELANAAGNKQFVTVNSGATLSINGKISGTTGVELVKTGVGLLVLSGDNSGFTGPITLETSGGILRMAHVNALGSTTSGTTVGTNAQLQLSNLTTPVNESLILNGPGVANSGAILSFAGNANNWAGVIRMDSNSTFGANASTTLTVSGVISDLGSGYSLVKEGTGVVVFSAANTYRGLSTVNDGTLIIENAQALGAGGTSANGTVVNKTLTKVGTLAIRGPAGGGFTVVNERLLLNGEGVNGLGALRNLRGNNTWASSVILGSPAPNGFSPYIGSANGTDLTISGVVSSPNGVYSLIKVDTGRLILNNANTFTGGTSVLAGIVNIRDSKALGTGAATVSNGAALQLEIDTGFDAFGRDLGNDSVTGVFNKLRISNNLDIQGRGVNDTGALRSISGINVYVGGITLQGFGAIGVDPDPNPSNTNLYFTNDYSLTAQLIREPLLPSRLSSELIKRGTGQLILPNANDYTNKTYIEQGWITVQNVQALGALLSDLSATVQPPAIVSAGASLHLKPPTADASFNFLKNLVLEGTGITHPFELINGKGALMSLGGNNTVGGIIGSRTSDIQLAGTAGIGVELLSPSTVSSLTISSQISDAPGRVGGITKLGSELLILQNIGTYTGANTVREGVLRVENDTALGTASTGTVATGNNTYTTTTTTVSRGISELQSLTLTGLPGTFTLSFNGQTTASLATTANAQTVQDALNALSSISGVGGNVRVTRSGNIFMVTFLGSFVGFNQPPLVATPSTGTIVDVATLMEGDGAALQLNTSVERFNGGLTTGMNIWYENLRLDSPGNNEFDSAPLTVLANDNMWRGSITLVDNTNIRIEPGSRLTVFGGINDTPALAADLSVLGGGKLAVGGFGTYRGTTTIGSGTTFVIESANALGDTGVAEIQTVSVGGSTTGSFTLTFNGDTTTPLSATATAAEVQAALLALNSIGGFGGTVSVTLNSGVYTVTFGGKFFGFNQPMMTALGQGGTTVSVAITRQGGGGTIVEDGGALEIQGSIVVAGEPLLLTGKGTTNASNIAVGWFQEGPAPINFGSLPVGHNPAIGNQAVTGRVTGVVADPSDPNVVYVSAAGGGVWRTRDGGLSWQPTFDFRNGQNEKQRITISGTTGTFTLTFNGHTTTALPFNASARQVRDALNGLASIGGAYGSVSVVQTGSEYLITFEGGLGGVDLPLMTGLGSGGATVDPIDLVADGIASDLPIFLGTMTVDAEPYILNVNNPSFPTTANPNYRTLYIGTGETNNSSDSFYGTGLYKSTDGGFNWTLVRGVEHQKLVVTGYQDTYTLTYNGQTTDPLPFNATATEVKDALDALSTIGGVGGFVNVTRSNTLTKEVQRITMNETTGNFTLSFNGATTTQLDAASGTLAADMDAALNALASVTAVGGLTVAADANTGGLYIVTFNQVGDQPLIVDAPGTIANIVQSVQGNFTYDITFGGTLANLDPSQITGTGNAGTGNAVPTVTTPNPYNPFYLKGISKILIDPVNTNLLYAASGDGGIGVNEIQQVRMSNSLNGGQFTLTFTGPDSTGAIISATTNPINYSNITAAAREQVRADIQRELNLLPNIGGIGGVVTVTLQTGGFGGTRFNITFSGVLAQTNVEQLTGNPPPPDADPWVSISTTRQGASQKVINGTTGGAGVWRMLNGTWTNLTNIVSQARDTVATDKPTPPEADAYTLASITNNANPPKTPGPDDDYRIRFLDTSVTWSDIALIYTDTNNTPDGIVGPRKPVLYAAQGTGSGSIYNGVFWTQSAATDTPVWYAGDPGGSPYSSPAVFPEPDVVDARTDDTAPLGQFAIPNLSAGGSQPAIAFNGTIKLTAFAGDYFNTSTVYASVASPTGSLRDGVLYKTTNGAQSWTTVGVPTFMASVGDYANSIMALSADKVLVGGYEVDNVARTQNIQITSDGGATWTDLSVGANGFGPSSGVHAFFEDSQGRFLAATDGGVFRFDPATGNWANLNGNLAISQINGIASHPNDLSIVYAGVQSNGVAKFTNNQNWTGSDSFGGGQVRIDPNNPNTVYSVQLQPDQTAEIRRTLDGGTTWTTITPPNIRQILVPLVLDQINTNRILTGGLGVFESFSQGNSWINLGPGGRGLPNGYSTTGIAISALQGPFVADSAFPYVTNKGFSNYDPDTIYITDGDSIYLTKDHALSWVERTSNLDSLGGGIYKLVVDPTNRDTVYVIRNRFDRDTLAGDDGQVFLSTNAGQSWSDISANLPDLPVWSLVLDPRTGDLYVGTDRGVYLRKTGNTDWEKFGSGMPNVQVRDLELNLSTNTLRAGTYGRGVYLLYLDTNYGTSGALRAVSGNSVWTGPIHLAGDAVDNHVVISAAGTQSLQNGIATASLNIVASIDDWTPGSDPRLIKVGQGDVVLAGINTYHGVTEIQQGALVIQNAKALGSPDVHTLVNDDTVLQLASDLEMEPITLNGNGILFNGHYTGSLRNIANNNTYTGLITLASDVTIGVDSGSTLTIGQSPILVGQGSIQDDGNNRKLIKELTGTLVFQNANTYGGATQVFAGVLQIQNSQALGSTTNGTDVFDGGQLQLKAPSTDFPMLITGERLTLSGTGAFGTGALLNVLGDNIWQGQVVLLSNPVLLKPTNAPATVPPSVIAIGVQNAIDMDNAIDTLTIDGVVSQSGGTFGLEKVGTGRLTLAKANSYGGTTTVTSGALRIQNSLGLGLSAAGTLVQDGAVLELDGDPQDLGSSISVAAEQLTLKGLGLDGKGALHNVSGENTWSGKVILQTNTGIQVGEDTELLISGKVQDPAILPVPAASLTKTGLGRLIFDNANPYGGLTTVSEGILNIRNDGALGTTGPEIQTVGVNATGTVGTFTLTFMGETTAPLTWDVPASGGVGPTASMENALNSLATIGGVGGSVTVTFSDGTYTVTFGGALERVNVPQITGEGFSGVNLSIATLRDGPEGTVVDDGATLQVEGGIAVTTEALTLNGFGFNNAGSLQNVSGDNIWGQSILLASDVYLGSDADSLDISGAILEANPNTAVTKVGLGGIVYSGDEDNTYTGLTTIREGTLAFNKNAPAQALSGNLVIGDAANDPATALWMQSDQVPDTADIRINSDGLLDLNGLAETLATLRVFDGQAMTQDNGLLTVSKLEMTGGTMTLGMGGQLILDGDVSATSSDVGSALITGDGTVELGDQTRNFVIANGPQDTDLLIESIMQGSASLAISKSGTGLLELDAINTYTGSTAISNGEVQVDGQIANVLLTGGILSGIGTVGTITGNSPAVGTVAPGNSGPGILTSGNAEWGPNTNFAVYLNNTIPGTGHDQLVVNGDISLNGANLQALVGPDVVVGDSFTIIQTVGGVVTGQFVQGEVVFLDGRKFSIDYSDPTTVVITRIKADVNLNLTLDSSSNPSVYGQTVLFTLTVQAEAGSMPVPPDAIVRFTLDGIYVQEMEVGNGTITFDPQALIGGPLSVGEHTLEAEFLGTPDFEAKSVTLDPPQQVNQADTQVTATATPNQPFFGQTVTVDILVTPVPPSSIGEIPTGSVTLYVDNTPLAPVDLSAGQASIDLSTLSAGTHAIKIDYSGDGNYNASTTTFSIIVAPKVNTTTSLVSSQSPTAAGALVTYTATVTPASLAGGVLDGMVNFYVGTDFKGDAPVVNGKAVLDILFSTVGTFNVSAVYQGNVGHNSSTSPTVQQRVVANASTITSLTSNANPSVYGQQVTITATVRGGPLGGPQTLIPTGSVTFFVNGVARATVALNANGVARFTGGMPVGNNEVKAVYNGNANFAASSQTLTQVTNAAATRTVLTSNRNPAYIGQATTVTATIVPVAPGSGIPAGTVTFYVNNSIISSPVPLNAQGKAVLNLGALPLGTTSIRAVYDGSTNFTTSQASFNQQVRNATKLTASLIGLAVVNRTFTLQVAARGADNSLVPGWDLPARLTLISAPPGGSLVGPRDATFVNGIANFAGLRVTRSGTYRIRITSGSLVLDLTIDSFGRLV